MNQPSENTSYVNVMFPQILCYMYSCIDLYLVYAKDPIPTRHNKLIDHIDIPSNLLTQVFT